MSSANVRNFNLFGSGVVMEQRNPYCQRTTGWNFACALQGSISSWDRPAAVAITVPISRRRLRSRRKRRAPLWSTLNNGHSSRCYEPVSDDARSEDLVSIVSHGLRGAPCNFRPTSCEVCTVLEVACCSSDPQQLREQDRGRDTLVARPFGEKWSLHNSAAASADDAQQRTRSPSDPQLRPPRKDLRPSNVHKHRHRSSLEPLLSVRFKCAPADVVSDVTPHRLYHWIWR